jgi:MFS family permease
MTKDKNFVQPGMAWRAVAAMFVLNGALFGIWASRIPAVAERHELGPGSLGGLLLLLAAGAIVAFPIAGKLSDTQGAAKVTRRVAVLYVGALFLIAVSPDFLSLAVALFLFGATHGAMDVAMNTWAGEAERRIGRPVMSSFHAMFSLGAGLGAASGFLAAANGFEVTPHFIAAGLLIAVVTFPFASIRWASDPKRDQTPGPVFVLPKGPLFFVGAIAFCASIGEGGIADWGAILLVFSTGADEAQAALGYSVFSVAMVATRLLGDRITRSFGPVTSARLAGATATLGVLIAVIPGTYNMTLVGFALMGMGYAIIMPLAFSRAANDPEILPGAAIASVSTLGYGGILLGPPIIGLAAEAMSLPAAFLILAALAGLIVVLGGSVARPELVKPAE